MHRSRIIALLTVLILLFTATSALATPLSSKRAEAERAREAVEALDVDLEIAAEDFNEARSAYEEITAKVEANEAHLADLRSRIGTLETHLASRAESMYRNGPLGMLDVLLGTTSFQEFATIWDFLSDLSELESVEVAELRDSREEAELLEAELDEQREQAKAEYDTMAARKAEVESRMAERRRILAGLEEEVARLEAQERRAEEAALASSRSSYSSRGDYGGNPTQAPRSEVVAIAMRYLGVPYRYGASGPDAFDCSGFTSYVYRQVGVSLPHSSRAQYGCGERVSRDNLQPGDLVFFGLSRIHHVGIYVGNGSYIHAPSTGDVVRVAPLNRSDYAGAVRP